MKKKMSMRCADGAKNLKPAYADGASSIKAKATDKLLASAPRFGSADPLSPNFTGPPERGNSDAGLDEAAAESRTAIKSQTYADVTPDEAPAARKMGVAAKAPADYKEAAAVLRSDKALMAQYHAGVASGKAFSMNIGGKTFKYAATASPGASKTPKAAPVSDDNTEKGWQDAYGSDVSAAKKASTAPANQPTTVKNATPTTMRDFLQNKGTKTNVAALKKAAPEQTPEDTAREAELMYPDPEMHMPRLNRDQARKTMGIQDREASNDEGPRMLKIAGITAAATLAAGVLGHKMVRRMSSAGAEAGRSTAKGISEGLKAFGESESEVANMRRTPVRQAAAAAAGYEAEQVTKRQNALVEETARGNNQKRYLEKETDAARRATAKQEFKAEREEAPQISKPKRKMKVSSKKG